MFLLCLDIFFRRRIAFEMPASKPMIPTHACVVRAMIFPVVKYRCESWTIKKAKSQRTDAFKLMLSNCGAGEDS